MRLLLVTTDYPPRRGGVARYYSNLVGSLPPGSVDVLVPKPARIWPRWLSWLRQMWRASRGVEAVWVGQVLPVGTVAWILHCFGGRPYIVSAHGLDVLLPLANPWRRWLVTRILRAAALVAANSHFTVDIVTSRYGVPATRTVVVYPGTSDLPPAGERATDEFRQQYGIPVAAPIVLGVGRLVRRKGFDLLLAAMERVWAVVPTAHCVIVGDGPEQESLAAAVTASSRPSQAHLINRLDDLGLASAYSCTSVLALPARTDGADVEGFGIVCVEAAALGVPVVATATGGIPEAVADGQTGILVLPNDVEALATALVRVLTDQNYRAALVAAGPAWAGRFTWSGSAQIFTDALTRTL